MFQIYNIDNLDFTLGSIAPWCDMVVADYIYESLDFRWADKYWSMLRDGGVMIAITDYHSSAEYKVHMKNLPNANLVNWLTWKNEFGNFKKDRFRQCHDDIIIFSKGKEFRFDGSKVQVEKATAKAKGLNPSGRMTKLATSVITDICLTTTSKERIKDSTGKLIRWQKPEALLRRIMVPFLKKGDLVVDPFMGSGTAGAVCGQEGWNYVGLEYDKKVYKIAKKRLKPFVNNVEYIPF